MELYFHITLAILSEGEGFTPMLDASFLFNSLSQKPQMNTEHQRLV